MSGTGIGTPAGSSATAYATSADYATFTGTTAPDGIVRLLTRASELLDDYCRTAIYAVDTDDLPTETDDIAAFRDAVCAQVEFWEAGDEEDDVLGPLETLSIGGVSAKPANVLTLAPRAARILRSAGLYSGIPVTL